MGNETSDRKFDHIKICLEEDIKSHFKTTGFEDVELLHEASPEVDLEKIDLSTSLFKKNLSAPIMICPTTGGHERGKEINKVLAEAAQNFNIPMCVGSQRAAIEEPGLVDTYQVRDQAPDILLLGNLGVAQLNDNYGSDEINEAIDMIDADAIGLHFNSLQEAIQPRGDTDFEKIIEKISRISPDIKKPFYVKETGAGINGEIASKLVKAGAEAVDVSGVGGTSWAGVEALRERSVTSLGNIFWDWGIPTSVSTAEVSESVEIPVISSGGIRTGIDAAKALALGADMVGIALPLFRAASRGKEELIEWLDEFIHELKVAMFLTGCERIEDLRKTPLLVSGKTKEWFKFRGIDIEGYRC